MEENFWPYHNEDEDEVVEDFLTTLLEIETKSDGGGDANQQGGSGGPSGEISIDGLEFPTDMHLGVGGGVMRAGGGGA